MGASQHPSYRPPADEVSSPTGTAAVQAFRRLLADVHRGAEARVDALVALAQQTLRVATWPNADEGLRTLVTRDGLSALPVFTGEDTLYDAVERFQWHAPEAESCWRSMPARAAFRYALDSGVGCVVVDVGHTHAVEFSRLEFSALLELAGEAESVGPFAATGRVSVSLLDAVNQASSHPSQIVMPEGRPPTTLNLQPLTLDLGLGTAPTVSAPAMAPTAFATASATSASATNASENAPSQTTAASSGTQRPSSPPRRSYPLPSAGHTPPGGSLQAVLRQAMLKEAVALPTLDAAHTTLAAPSDVDEALLDHVAECLRSYPEIEWAAAVRAEVPEGIAALAIAIRVDPSYTQRLPEIADAVGIAARSQHANLALVWLETPEVLRTARTVGRVFYPWKS